MPNGHAIDLRPLFASLRKPSTDRLHLTRDQFVVLALVRTYEGADGWSSAPGELGWSHRAIGQMTGTSQAYAKHVVRDMRRRRILSTNAENADGRDGLANALRMNAPAEWTLLTPEQKKPRPKGFTVRLQRRGDCTQLVIPGKGIASIPSNAETKIGAPGAAAAVTVRGELSLRVSERANVLLSPGLQLAPEVKLAQTVPGSPATPVLKSNGTGTQVVPGSPATPLPPAIQSQTLDMFHDGAIDVEWDAGTPLMTARQLKELQRMASQHAGAEQIVGWLRAVGLTGGFRHFRAIARLRENSAAVEAKKTISLDGPPTGIWARALHKLQGRVNPHSFGTWFRATSERGTIDGALVIAVPDTRFVTRLHKDYRDTIRETLRSIGHAEIRFQFVAIDSLEILAPPQGAEAGENENLRRRTA